MSERCVTRWVLVTEDIPSVESLLKMSGVSATGLSAESRLALVKNY